MRQLKHRQIVQNGETSEEENTYQLSDQKSEKLILWWEEKKAISEGIIEIK